jgi:hypothetical protein
MQDSREKDMREELPAGYGLLNCLQFAWLYEGKLQEAANPGHHDEQV